MNNFDLRKFLAEGKLYKENLMDTRSEAEQDAKIFHKDLIVKYGFDNVADALEALYDNAEEGGAGYENIADLLKMDNSMLIDMIVDNLTEGKDKPSNIQKLMAAGYSKSNAEDFADEFEQGGSKVPQRVKDILTNESVKSKMKMSELKAKIRTEILAELSLNEDEEDNFMGGAESEADVDFYEGLEEATKDGDGEVPSKDKDTDVNIEDKEEVEVDVEEKPKVSGVDGEFLDQLEDLKDEADAMGDNKLERQIDNTITYFTRQHIAKDTNESLELEEADDMALIADLEAELREGDKEYYDAAERDDAAHIDALKKDMEDDKKSSKKVDEAESKELKVGEKVDVFNSKGKYSKESWWGPDEYLNNAEIVNITGDKVTVKDINDDEYEVDSSDVSKLDESIAFPLWNKIK